MDLLSMKMHFRYLSSWWYQPVTGCMGLRSLTMKKGPWSETGAVITDIHCVCTIIQALN